MFSKENPMGAKIVLIKNENIISDDKSTAESFNSHFVTITDALCLDPAFKDVGTHKTPDKKIDTAVKKYKDHPSIIAIKRKDAFEFRFVTLLNVMTKVEALEANESSSDNLPTKIIQEAKEAICPYLTDSINAAMNSCVFSEKRKEAEVSVIYKKGDTCQIMSYRPISILSARSKIFERIISKQINKLMAGMLSPLLSGFRQGYSTQHALFRVVEKWKKHLDMMGIVGTILMDLSHCIPTIY